jgi:hypothetical protein
MMANDGQLDWSTVEWDHAAPNPSSIEALVQMVGPGAGASRDQTEMAVTFPFQVVPHKASDVNLAITPSDRHPQPKRCTMPSILLSYVLLFFLA